MRSSYTRGRRLRSVRWQRTRTTKRCICCFARFGCHSMRHLVGGVLDVMSGKPMRKPAYTCESCLNRWHMKWAWISLIWVGFSDFYVRMCAMGVWTDLRLL